MSDLAGRMGLDGFVVGDGAWGTALMTRGLAPGDCPESVNLENPEWLREIAATYVEAGADLLTTNTFGGSPLALRRHGLDTRADEIHRVAVRTLRDASAGRAKISGSIGPCGRILEPYGDIGETEVYESFERQATLLAEAGADLFCVETMTDLREAELAVRAARQVAPDLPILATMTFDATPRGFFTVMGVDIRRAADGLARAGADAVGSNCGHGIDTMIEIAREFRHHTQMPVVIQSNAGLPESRDGRLVHPETPSFWAGRLDALIDAGATVIGGCCGAGPEHVRSIRRAVDRRAIST